MKKFKKIYLEITNVCNLNCDFCIKNSRTKQFITIEKFKIVLNKIENYTDYLYFHIMGEPLMHPKINELIDIASKKFKINITTNGYLINKIKDNKNIRQLNISLHSFDEKYLINLDEYLDNIFEAVSDLISNNTYVSLRLWTKNKYNSLIIDYINKKFNLNIKYDIKNYKINNNLFINNFHEFIWPDLDNDYYCETGSCYAIKDHIGILVCGTIVPCCLDSKGCINLGNIYSNNIDEILESKRVKEIVDGFKKKEKKELLCKHCKFL